MTKLKNFFKIIFLVANILAISHSEQNDFSDYKNHPCIRDCSISPPMRCEYNWTSEWYTVLSKACFDCPFNLNDCDRPDCISSNGFIRAVMTINKMLPGPSIQVCENDHVVVNVYNGFRMGEGTTIHWHGILQRESPYMDGVALVTQCSINPHSTFQYSFIARDIGTHFWHAHSGIQRTDGIFGAFIVRQNKSNDVHVNEYDEDRPDHVIVLNDWYNNSVAYKFAFHIHSDGREAAKTNSILINGRAAEHGFTRGNQTFKTPRSVFEVNSGLRYRFRIIHSGTVDCPIQFSIESHKFSVIALDGHPTEKVQNVEAIFLYPGERVDIIVTANNKIGNYWIKARGYKQCTSIATAILNYNQSEIPSPNLNDFEFENREVESWQINSLEEIPNNNYLLQIDSLKSFNTNATNEYFNRIKETPDKKFYLGMEYKFANNPEYHNPDLYPIATQPFDLRFYTPQFNSISMLMPPSPSLSQWNDIPKDLICNEFNRDVVCYNSTFCSCIHVIEVGLDELVEFIIIDETINPMTVNFSRHPIHLHGHSFAVVAIEKLDDNLTVSIDLIKKLDMKNMLKRNFDNPVLKDTVMIKRGGYTIVRFIANNPGTWFAHCHNDLHSEHGLAFIVKVGDVSDFPKKPNEWPKCGNYFYERMNKMNKNKATYLDGSMLRVLFPLFFLIHALLI